LAPAPVRAGTSGVVSRGEPRDRRGGLAPSAPTAAATSTAAAVATAILEAAPASAVVEAPILEATAAATTASASASATAPGTATTAATLPGLGFVDPDAAPVELCAVELLHRRVCIGIILVRDE